MVDPGFAENELTIDWDHLLENLPDDPNFFDFGDQPTADVFSTSPDSGCSFTIDDVEQYLMIDDDHKGNDDNLIIDRGFSDLIIDSSSGSDRDKDSSSPESGEEVGAEEEEEGKEREKPSENGAVVTRKEDDNGVVDVEDDGDCDGNDPVAKKRKRQMRNRDAAVRSRERKKMYVRDLEIKSKYYEAECKRLGIMLQCCVAENQALRLSLHNTKAFDASMSKQESAVLLMESLLLGSLLGFLGIICLFSHLLLPALETIRLENAESPEWENNVARTKPASKLLFRNSSIMMMMGKRCKASRSRMKLSSLFAPQVIM